MPQGSAGAAFFINVDLDIEAPYDLAPLVAELGARVFDLHTGVFGEKFETHLELSGDANQPADAETAMGGFIGLLRQLTPDNKRRWDGATKRDFNIGIQGGSNPTPFELALLPATLAAVADLGARVVITVYPPDEGAEL